MHKFYRLTLLSILIILICGLSLSTVIAQSPFSNSRSLDATETLSYDLSFRLTFVRGKVGEARLINKRTNNNQYFTQLIFRTMGIGETVFPMRDTLETLFSKDKYPIRFEKRTNENDFVMNDVVSYTYTPSRTALKVFQRDLNRVRVDTMLYLPSEEIVADMLSTIALVRVAHPQDLKSGKKYRFTSPDGAKLVKSYYSLSGTDRIKIGTGEIIPVLKVSIQIDDPAFKKGSNAMEVWLSDDERLLPVFISAGLKVGYAECRLVNYSRTK